MSSSSIKRSVLALLLTLVVSSSWLVFLYYLSGPDKRLQLPRDLSHLVELREVLEEYSETRRSYTIVLFSSLYLYKQSFAIPGSVFLNLMSGLLFGVWMGFPLVCLLSATGASSCFLLSHLLGRAPLERWLPGRIAYFSKLVEKSRREGGLFTFLLSLRIFPMTPNWLVNMASPMVGVGLGPFFLSVLLGLGPYNFITVSAGSTLGELQSLDDVLSWRVALLLGLLALGILNPFKLVFKRFQQKRTEDGGSLVGR